MHLSLRARPLYRGLFVAVLGGTLIAAGAAAESARAAGAVEPAGRAAAGTYIVQLSTPSIAEYRGGVAGLAATSPRVTGEDHVDPDSLATRRYRGYLDDRQDDVLDALRGSEPDVTHEYRSALSGFAAELTAAQVDQLRRTPGVRSVERDGISELTASADARLGGSDPATPWLGGDGAAWLRLTAPNFLTDPGTGVPGAGIWNRIGGGPTAVDGPGAGRVIGVIDGGIAATNPSFAASSAGGEYEGAAFPAPPSTFTGTCDRGMPGSTFPACTNKLIGARSFTAGVQASTYTILPVDLPISPIDTAGHGSHTASTAGGNYAVASGFNGQAISGMAPRAHIVAYKVCWAISIGVRCFDSDILAAVEAGIEDGVDVLTVSISASTTQGSVRQRAFLAAYDAGIFVSSSAGNNGPSLSTFGATPSPWAASVASSTTNRSFDGVATLTGSTGPLVVRGSMLGQALPSSPVILASDAGLAGANAINVRRCFPNTLDAAKVVGKVVVCERGVNARTEKSSTVQAAGGVGMLLGNAVGGATGTFAEPHVIPTVHLDQGEYASVLSLISTTATAGGTTTVSMQPARGAAVAADGRTPRIASTSSRGPISGTTDLPGPDLSAPGVGVLAAINGTSSFGLMDGTSMATPHVAGSAALLQQRHPDWSPATIKSALATTANPNVLVESGSSRASALLVGSGEIDPNRADSPGLVVVPSRTSLSAYQANPTETAGQLNLPAIIGWDAGGRLERTRRLTSVDAASHTWTISGNAPSGMSIETTPPIGDHVAVPAGGEVDLAVRVRVTTGALNVAQTGDVTLTDEGGRTVRIPVTVRPTALAVAPTLRVTTTAPTATSNITASVGYDGAFSAQSQGVAQAQRSTLLVRQMAGTGTANDANAVLTQVAAATAPSLLAVDVTDFDSGAGNDVDLAIYTANASGVPVSAVVTAASVGASESVSIITTPGTRYVIAVWGYAVSDAAGVPVTMDVWNSANPDAPLTVSAIPASVAAGDQFTATVSASGLDDLGRYRGVVTYHSGANGAGTRIGSTIVDIQRDATPPVIPCTSCGGPGTTPPSTTTPTVGTDFVPAPNYDVPVAGQQVTPPPHSTPAVATRPSLLEVTGAFQPEGIGAPPARANPRLWVSTPVRGAASRRLQLTLRGSEPLAVSISVLRNGRLVATGRSSVFISIVARPSRPRLDHRLAPGRYTVRMVARADDGRSTSAARTLVVD